MSRKQLLLFPCAVCGRNCESNTIECTDCRKWVHKDCAHLSDVDFRHFSERNVSFHCPVCLGIGGDDDFSDALARIRSAKSSEVQDIATLIRLYVNRNPITSSCLPGSEDKTSVAILKKFNPNMLDIVSPRATFGDGNCCYRAVSLGLFETQALHGYVRCLTAAEVKSHRRFYDTSSGDFVLTDTRVVTGRYGDVLNDVLTDGGYAELIHIYAIATAFNIAIMSYCPTGSIMPTVSPYHVIVRGRGVSITASPSVSIMWTTMSVPRNFLDFKPNHIILLSEKQSTATAVPIEILTDDERESMDVSFDESFFKEQLRELNSMTSTPLPSPAACNTTTSTDATEEYEVNVKSLSTCSTAVIKPSSSVPSRMRKLHDNHFLATEKVIELLITKPPDIMNTRIPKGSKTNVFCLFDNEENSRRRAIGLNSVFDDDCGVWDSSQGRTTAFPYIVVDGKPVQRLFLRNNQYCTEHLIGSKRIYKARNPQPAPNQLLTLYRTYATQKLNNAYRRRVSWCDTIPGIAVVEYLGQSKPTSHGNNNRLDRYIRTPQVTLDRLARDVKTLASRVAYEQAVDEIPVGDAPRNVRVAQNLKYNNTARKRNASHGFAYRMNFADEIQSLCSMAATDDFVRSVTITSDKVPCVILYTERQISDLKSLCFKRNVGSVLSFDKTYNLGSLFVTVCVYRNVVLRRAASGDTPIFLGPMFLHGNSDFETYAVFFGHLSARLMSANFEELTLGSDEEASLRKAMRHCFPDAAIVSCTRHIKENFIRNSAKLTPAGDASIKDVVRQCFGKDGLTSLKDDAAFSSCLNDITSSAAFQKCPAQTRAYFDRKVVPLLKSNVDAGRNGWTNNACESVNHVLKQRVKWQRKLLPDLVEELRKLVRSQYNEADRALFSQGDFRLAEKYSRKRISLEEWCAMTDAQKEKHRNTTFTIPDRQPTATATDDMLQVNFKGSAGRKINQRKRIKAHRTTSVAKQRHT